MATVKRATPGLYSAVLHTLLVSDPRTWSVAATLDRLTAHLSADEAQCLPDAIGGVLPLLRTDPERMRFAAEIAARMDFFEVAGAIADLALTLSDRRMLLAAASLCGNPAVEPQVRARVADEVRDDPVGRIRLDPAAVPATADEERLHWQRWPGIRANQERFALAPVVVLDRGLEADRALRLGVRLVKAGANIRRLEPESQIPLWFGPQTVLVCRPPARLKVRNSFPGFSLDQILVAGIPVDDRGIGKLLHEVNAALPARRKLRLAAVAPELATRLWEPEVFAAGAYQTKEAAFLTGVSSSSFNGMRRRGLLVPRRSGVFLWTFRDLVAVRTWAYLKSVSPGRVSSAVVPALAGFVGDAEAVKLGVTSQGRVLVDRGAGWEDVESGQTQIDLPIADVDEAFQPFIYGNESTPNLLRASENTRLHPSILHGTPHLEGRRISARALAGLYQRGGHKAILGAYPELQDCAFEDTVSVGLQLLRAR